MTTAPGTPTALPTVVPDLNRRPRRRRGAVLLGFAVACFGAAWWLVATADTGSTVEATGWFASMMLGFCLVVLGVGLLVVALLLLARRRPRPAWFVDPDEPTLTRWWDGRSWTARTTERDAVAARLAPLRSSSVRRRRIGAAMLVGGVGVTVLSRWAATATAVPVTDPTSAGSPLPMLLLQLVLPAALTAVVGLFLVLTVADDVPPGWYADPSDAARRRYWDGRAWTGETSPGTSGRA